MPIWPICPALYLSIMLEYLIILIMYNFLFNSSESLPHLVGGTQKTRQLFNIPFYPLHSLCVVSCLIYFTQSQISPGSGIIHQIVCDYAIKDCIKTHKRVELGSHTVEFKLLELAKFCVLDFSTLAISSMQFCFYFLNFFFLIF